MSLAVKVSFPVLTLEKTVASEEEISVKHSAWHQCTRNCMYHGNYDTYNSSTFEDCFVQQKPCPARKIKPTPLLIKG